MSMLSLATISRPLIVGGTFYLYDSFVEGKNQDFALYDAMVAFLSEFVSRLGSDIMITNATVNRLLGIIDNRTTWPREIIVSLVTGLIYQMSYNNYIETKFRYRDSRTDTSNFVMAAAISYIANMVNSPVLSLITR